MKKSKEMAMKDNMIKVYIASPYTDTDQAQAVKTQIDAAEMLYERGFNCYVPLLSHFTHMIHPRKYSHWIEIGLDWVSSCDCLLRLPGESRGADKEEQLARKMNLPVFHSIKEISNHYSMES